jgi:hypothetical protein
MKIVCFVDRDSMSALKIHCHHKSIDIVVTREGGSICIAVLAGDSGVIEGIIDSINGSNNLSHG